MVESFSETPVIVGRSVDVDGSLDTSQIGLVTELYDWPWGYVEARRGGR